MGRGHLSLMSNAAGWTAAEDPKPATTLPCCAASCHLRPGANEMGMPPIRTRAAACYAQGNMHACQAGVQRCVPALPAHEPASCRELLRAVALAYKPQCRTLPQRCMGPSGRASLRGELDCCAQTRGRCRALTLGPWAPRP